jgi:hypothetical protein
MAKCCQNLTHFGAESVAVKSYIAMMPLFSKSDTFHTPLPWTAGGQREARAHALQQALQELLDVIVHEKAVFSRVFQKWQARTRRGPLVQSRSEAAGARARRCALQHCP